MNETMNLTIDTQNFDAAALLARLQTGVTDPGLIFADLPGTDVATDQSSWPLPDTKKTRTFEEGDELHAYAPNGERITQVHERYDGAADVTFTLQEDGHIEVESGDTEVAYETTRTVTQGGQPLFYTLNGAEYRFDQLTFRKAPM